MAENIPLTGGPVSIERTLDQGDVVSSGSLPPESGPQTGTVIMEIYEVSEPDKKQTNLGAEISLPVWKPGTFRITVTPQQNPFYGFLRIG